MTIHNRFLAIPAADLRVISGANIGDNLNHLERATLEDQYRLISPKGPKRLTIATDEKSTHLVGCDTECGRTGTTLGFEGVVTLISLSDACVVELVVITTKGCGQPQTWLVPTVPLNAKTDYALTAVEVGYDAAAAILAQMISASFVGGTRLLTGNRVFRPVEGLRAGDTLYTRDNGVQPIRGISKQTVRAEGQIAPVQIAANTFGTHDALSLSPMHRLFAYRRATSDIAGPAAQLVTARNLVNGSTVTHSKGGFVDYYKVVMDNHEILFAEGIAVESQIPLPVFDRDAADILDTSASRGLRRQASYAQMITYDDAAPFSGKRA